MPLRLTWDEAKAAINEAKHKVSFDIATRVFLDSFTLSEQDRLVAHTVHSDKDGTEEIRIISARRAERSERRRYGREKYRQLRT